MPPHSDRSTEGYQRYQKHHPETWRAHERLILPHELRGGDADEADVLAQRSDRAPPATTNDRATNCFARHRHANGIAGSGSVSALPGIEVTVLDRWNRARSRRTRNEDILVNPAPGDAAT